TFQATWITDHPDTVVDWRARLELDSEVTRLSEALKNASPEKGSRNTPFTSQLIYEQLLSVCRSLSLVVPSFLLCGVDLQRPGGLLSSNGSLHMHLYGNTDLGAHLGMRDLQRGYKVCVLYTADIYVESSMAVETNLQSFQAQERHHEAQPAHTLSPPHASERLNDLDSPQARAQPPSVPSDINGNCQNLKIKKSLLPQRPRNMNNLTDRGQASSNDGIVPTSARGQVR
ncbi:hypothetical protein CPAR01_14583, partial [Colletotrichum paranaense]